MNFKKKQNLAGVLQRQRLKEAARSWYGDTYNVDNVYGPDDTKFYLDEEYIPEYIDDADSLQIEDNPDNSLQLKKPEPKSDWTSLWSQPKALENTFVKKSNPFTVPPNTWSVPEAVKSKFMGSEPNPSGIVGLEHDPRESARNTLSDEVMEEKNIDLLYNHLKQADVEGYSRQPYCDTSKDADSTVGIGINITDPRRMENMTITPKPEAPAPDNMPYTSDQKTAFHKRHRKFCNYYPKVVTKDGIISKTPLKEKQFTDYSNKYNEQLPYFDEDEMKDWTVKYIRNAVIPHLRKTFQNNYGMDFYRDLGNSRRLGFMDRLYNLGEKKFILDNQPKKRHWPRMHQGILDKKWEIVAEQSKIPGPAENRNTIVHDLFLRED